MAARPAWTALTLCERWTYLPNNVADPVQWIAGTHLFHYRKTVVGGFSFVICDAATLEKRPALDQAPLAAALTKAIGSRSIRCASLRGYQLNAGHGGRRLQDRIVALELPTI